MKKNPNSFFNFLATKNFTKVINLQSLFNFPAISQQPNRTQIKKIIRKNKPIIQLK